MRFFLIFFLLILCNLYSVVAQQQRYTLIGNHLQEQTEVMVFDSNGNIIAFGMALGDNPIGRGLIIKMNINLDSLRLSLTDSILDNVFIWSGCAIQNNTYSIGTRSTACCDSIGWYKFYIEKRNKEFELIDTFISSSSYYDKFLESVAQDNHIYAVGYTASYTTEAPGDTSLDGYIMKLDTNLNVIWGHNFGTTLYDQFLAVCSDSDGNIIAGGGTTNANPYDQLNNAYLVKVDTAGNLIWQKNYGLRYKTNEYVYALADARAGDGSFYAAIACYQFTIVGLDPLYGYSCIARLDANGDTLWIKRFRKYNQADWSVYNQRWYSGQIWDIEVADNGDVIFCGDWYNYTDSTNTNRDGFICRYTANGDSLWRYDLVVKGFNDFKNIVLDEQGYIYGVGRTQYIPGTNTLTPGGTSAIFVKLDANGCIWDSCTAQFVNSLPLPKNEMYLDVFPNPAAQVLHLRLESDNSPKEILIYDLNGRCVVKQQITNGITQLNISHLNAGIYVLQCINPYGETIVRKFVKE
jgi:hypothetical protein